MTHEQRRRHERYQVNIAAKCFVDDLAPIAVRIIDISEGGFGLNCVLPFQKGADLKLSLPDVGVFRATVAWERDGRCGLRLLADHGDISQAELDGLSALLAHVAARPAQAH